MAALLQRFLERWQPEPEPDTIEVQAIPGLITLLDTALYQSVEPMLTATVHSGHAWLEAWFDVKEQAVLVLKRLKHDDIHGKMPSPNRQQAVETLARLSLDSASDAIILLTTDRLAQSANLSEPFHQFSHHHHHNNNSNSGGGGGTGHAGGGPNGHAPAWGTTLEELRALDAGNRRRIPIVQRGRDCWESPILHCLDQVWAEDNYGNGVRMLRLLHKQASAIEQLSPDHLESKLFDSSIHRQQKNHNSSQEQSSSSKGAWLSPALERAVTILVQLLRETLPLRLHQFRASFESNAEAIKRLYILKCEYRAPFRSFLEAHAHLQKVPRLEAIESSLASAVATERTKTTTTTSKSESSATLKDKGDGTMIIGDDAAGKVKELLQTPAFVEMVALEQEMDTYEMEISKELLPMCNLARYLDAKKARISATAASNNNIKKGFGMTEEERVELDHLLLHRLKNILCKPQRSSVLETSTGIRPLLLDLQGLARDDEWSRRESNVGVEEQATKDLIFERIAVFCQQMKVLVTLVVTNNNNSNNNNNGKQKGRVFVSSSSRVRDVDLSASLVRDCQSIDLELLEARLKDWFTMVERQHNVLEKFDLEDLRRQILEAELRAGLSSMQSAPSTEKAMNNIHQRIQVLHHDCEKRYSILKEVVEHICLREMNLEVILSPPRCKYEPLVLKPTSAQGIFGEALELAEETLPIG